MARPYRRQPLCRHCYGLRYACQLEHAWDRLLRRRAKLSRRLGADDGFGPPPRPKGMHSTTYDRFVDEYDEIEARLDLVFLKRLSPALARLGEGGPAR